jgi:hypothetical protein
MPTYLLTLTDDEAESLHIFANRRKMTNKEALNLIVSEAFIREERSLTTQAMADRIAGFVDHKRTSELVTAVKEHVFANSHRLHPSDCARAGVSPYDKSHSLYKGVTRVPNSTKWYAQMSINADLARSLRGGGGTKHIKGYDTEIEAAKAAECARRWLADYQKELEARGELKLKKKAQRIDTKTAKTSEEPLPKLDPKYDEYRENFFKLYPTLRDYTPPPKK